MRKGIKLVLLSALVTVLIGFAQLSINSAYAITETVFFEDFDDPLSGWSQSVCIRNDPPRQTCNIGQHTVLENGEPPNSVPNWGFVTIVDVGVSTSGGAEVRFQKSFNVIEEDDYDVSSWLGTMSCSGCNKRTQLYIDGNLIFERVGVDRSKVSVGNQKFFDSSSVHLTAGMHDVEMSMRTNVAHNGNFRVSFDDITISREVDQLPPQPIGHAHDIELGDPVVISGSAEANQGFGNSGCPPDHVLTGFNFRNEGSQFSWQLVCTPLTVLDFIGVLFAIGGDLLQIDTISILLAYAIVNAVWMAPIGIGIGVGVYLTRRRFVH